MQNTNVQYVHRNYSGFSYNRDKYSPDIRRILIRSNDLSTIHNIFQLPPQYLHQWAPKERSSVNYFDVLITRHPDPT